MSDPAECGTCGGEDIAFDEEFAWCRTCGSCHSDAGWQRPLWRCEIGRGVADAICGTLIHVHLPVPELIAHFKGARLALRAVQGVADTRDPELAEVIGVALKALPGGDNPGHRDD